MVIPAGVQFSIPVILVIAYAAFHGSQMSLLSSIFMR